MGRRDELAKAWEEGAEHAWSVSGEGGNGEYNWRSGNAYLPFRALHPETSNPYAKEPHA